MTLAKASGVALLFVSCLGLGACNQATFGQAGGPVNYPTTQFGNEPGMAKHGHINTAGRAVPAPWYDWEGAGKQNGNPAQ